MRRLVMLDAIRGIASISVVLSHLHYTARAETAFLDNPLFRGLVNSSFAVAIFFTLSGMVLSLQLRKEPMGYIQFAIRRAFRLLPATIAAVTASYLIYVLWQPEPVASRGAWFNDVSWPSGIDFTAYLGHLALLGPVSLLRPLWSLVIEWRVSLLFPIIVWLYITSPRLTPVAVIGFAVAFSTVKSIQVENPYTLTAFYSAIFMFGILLAEYWKSAVVFFRRHPAVKLAAWVVCFYYLMILEQYDSFLGWLTSGVAGTLLIALCMASPKARRFLKLRPLQFLGRISYSLYLCHMIVIGILFRAMDGISPLLIAVASIAISILIASLMQNWIEAPFVRLGKKLSSPQVVKLATATR
jgi:peptidoglycan/LPS O-acetylase OafA/YrhL